MLTRDMNIADFKAQLAACEKGARELVKMAEHYSVETVHAYMIHVQDNADADPSASGLSSP